MNLSGTQKIGLDILLPHYNDPAGLERSLLSIMNQTWVGNSRVIVADDGSDANVLAQVKKIIGDQCILITFIVEPQNLGRPNIRNRLLNEVSAPFVAWLDCGDEWYPEKLERQFKCFFQRVGKGMPPDDIWITCDYDWKRGKGKSKSVKQFVQGDQAESLLAGDHLRAYLWTILGTRSSFEKAGYFDTRLSRLQDLDHFLSFVRRGGRLEKPEKTGSLCVYFKDDTGCDAREIRKCYDVIFAKHFGLFEKYSAKYERVCRTKADFVAERYARLNGRKLLSAFYLVRAAFRSPRIVLKKIARAILWRLRR